MDATTTSPPAPAATDVLIRVVQALRGLVAGLEVEAVPVADAPGWWRRLDEIDRLVAAAKVVLARRVDESSAAHDAGLRSTAEWFAAIAGGSVRSGQELLAASKRIADLPVVEAAVRDGALSAAQVGPVAHAAEADPDAQRDLVRAARVCSFRELLDRCADVRAKADPDPERTAERIRKARRLRATRDREGAFCLFGRGPVEDGAELDTVLRAVADEIFQEAHAAGREEPYEAYRWDALVETARRAWAHMHGAPSTNGAATAGPAATDEPPAEGRAARNKVGAPRARKRRPGVNAWSRAVLRVDHEALVRGHVDGDETCEIAGVGPVPVSVARRLLGESTLHLVVTRGVAVRNVTYIGRERPATHGPTRTPGPSGQSHAPHQTPTPQPP